MRPLIINHNNLFVINIILYYYVNVRFLPEQQSPNPRQSKEVVCDHGGGDCLGDAR